MKMVASGCSSTAGAAITASTGRSRRDQTRASRQPPSIQTRRAALVRFCERGIGPGREHGQVECGPAADRRRAQGDDPDRNARQQAAERSHVSFLERRADRRLTDHDRCPPQRQTDTGTATVCVWPM